MQKWFGRYDEQATHAHFHAFKAAGEANGRVIPAEARPTEFTVADLVAAYLDRHVHEHYAGRMGRRAEKG